MSDQTAPNPRIIWVRQAKEPKRGQPKFMARPFDPSFPYPPASNSTISNWLYGEWFKAIEVVE